jgi:predicted Zn-dependent protease
LRLDWDAAYLDGRTAARRPATVHITRTGLDVALPESGSRFFWTFREIRQTQGTYAGEQVRLERGGELAEALLIGDVGFLSAARAASPEAAHLHEPARRRVRVGLTFGALLATIALAVGIYYVGIPAFARVAAARVPVSWEEKLGTAIVDHFAPVSRRCEDPARQARIDEIVARLTAKAPQPYTFHITVVDSGIVNAVAAPGGHIILFRGLLERTDSAEELAGVLAHEIEHVLHRHVTRAIFQQASTGVLMAALVGDVSSVVAYGLEGARTLGDLQMTRAAESEADREGMRLLQEAGVDTKGMITFFEKLSSRERDRGGDSLARYLRTHPTTSERIATLRALAAAAPPPAGRLLPDDDWDDVKSLCGELPAGSSSPPR